MQYTELLFYLTTIVFHFTSIFQRTCGAGQSVATFYTISEPKGSGNDICQMQ